MKITKTKELKDFSQLEKFSKVYQPESNWKKILISILNVQVILLPFIRMILGLELDSFLVRSSFVILGYSVWPVSSARVPYSLVVLLLAVLMKWMERLNTELFGTGSKQHSIVAQEIGLGFWVMSSDWYRRNNYGTNVHCWSRFV